MNMHPNQTDAQDADEARLTAYALGELDGSEHAAERAAIEALLAHDPAARAAVDEIRELAGVLTAELAAEATAAAPAEALTPQQRHALERAMGGAAVGEATLPAAAAAAGPAHPAPNGAAQPGAEPVRARAPGAASWLRFVPALAAAALIAVMVWQLGGESGREHAPDTSAPVARGPESVPAGGIRQDVPSFTDSGPRGKPAADALVKSAGEASRGNAPALAGQLPAREGKPSPEADIAKLTPVVRPDGTYLDADVYFEEGIHKDAAALGYVGAAEPKVEKDAAGIPGTGDVALVTTPAARDFITGRGRSEAAAPGAAPAAGPARLAGAAPSLHESLEALGYVNIPVNAPAAVPLSREATPSSAAANDVLGVPADAHGARERHPGDSGYRYFRTAPGGEGYEPIVESGFQSPLVAPRSTFSVDVDTASYANVRRFLNAGQLPPADAVRLEELINYFRYDYPQPDGAHPFSVTADVTACPWAPGHRLVRLGLQGRTVPQAERAPSNLVFLVDVSGSMDSPDKLPLVQASLRMLAGRLDARDRIALVTYAGSAGLVLDSTNCGEQQAILDALDRLKAGGSTAGGAGIALAYQVATRHFIKGGTNRVILATDGDFNVGATSREELQALIERSAKSGVFLTVLGFGTGNLKDGTAELLADKGNGNYAYIDTLAEAQKVLVEQMGGTLVTIAKDVKLQVEFNPGRVAAYRLLGYENRALATRDFNDDRKDAGEIGAGHSVTALYEVIPVGVGGVPAPDALRYQQEAPAPAAPPVLNDSPELLYVALRYKQPDADSSTLLGQPLLDEAGAAAGADADGAGARGTGPDGAAAGHGQMRTDVAFAAAVAEFGMLLRGSGHAGSASWESVIALAEAGRGADADGYRAEFIRLARIAWSLQQPGVR